MTLQEVITDYCHTIGVDASLVQGAGGNVSWKAGNTLWIKASGAWLADANRKSIFVPVDLIRLKDHVKSQRFDAAPVVLHRMSRRPSIETMLHSIVPHRIVVHTHPIAVLVHLVQAGCVEILQRRLPPSVSWLLVDYHKPGAKLAEALQRAIERTALSPSVLFLANHGMLVGGETVNEVDHLHRQVLDSLRELPRPLDDCAPSEIPHQLIKRGYRLPENPLAHRIALDDICLLLVEKHWALVPDIVVFLGDRPQIFDTSDDAVGFIRFARSAPAFVLIRHLGVFIQKNANQAIEAMLVFFAEIAGRLKAIDHVRSLTRSDIEALMEWEAERYRANTGQ